MTASTKHKLLPFSLTALVLLLDQGIKAFIVKNWSLEGWTSQERFIKNVFDSDFLYIVHVRNKAIAFSLGHNLPESLRPFLFIIAPILVLSFLVWYYMSSREFNTLQRWAVAGIIGGGLGNIIDRIFRPDGVVDFISVKFFGILGWDRWPTFNIADSSVVICCILFLISIITGSKNSNNESAG